VWDFEGDFSTLSFVDLPMINKVDVRDEKRDNEGKGAKGKGHRDSKGRDNKRRDNKKICKKNKQTNKQTNIRSVDRIGVWIQNKGPDKQNKK
jgi:hypothetical protein